VTYEEVIRYLYASTPVFEQSGASAYKPGLGTSIALDNYLGNPHQSYKTIHVAGTNGKGSVCHLLAAILRQSGFKTGLYTSPHLVDFRERIRVNGEMIPEEYVIDFVERHKAFFEPLHPSFFELTTGMALAYFRDCGVDYAVIETGLGGRLDSTNIITPVLSIITNITRDHTQYLGNTLPEIAAEKAGIIKPSVPVLTGDTEPADTGVFNLFQRTAEGKKAPFYSALSMQPIPEAEWIPDKEWVFHTADYGIIRGELHGIVQAGNARTVLAAIQILTEKGVDIPPEAVREGFARVVELTGLMGRWQQLCDYPKVICDTAHNTGAWKCLAAQLEAESLIYSPLHIVAGFSSDKDIEGIMTLMPEKAVYYFTQASTRRAFPAGELKAIALKHGLQGESYPAVAEAVEKAVRNAKTGKKDLVFIGGSNFVVAEAIPLFQSQSVV
jgi:dihydrofolate synthase/folylpolyglutamate synthase